MIFEWFDGLLNVYLIIVIYVRANYIQYKLIPGTNRNPPMQHTNELEFKIDQEGLKTKDNYWKIY